MKDATCATCLYWRATHYSQAVDPRPESQVRECLCPYSQWAAETCGAFQPACEEHRTVVATGEAEA